MAYWGDLTAIEPVFDTWFERNATVLIDGVQIAFGTIEIVTGAVVISTVGWTGFGAVGGALLIANGVDDIQSSARRLGGDPTAESGKYALGAGVAGALGADAASAARVGMFTDIGGSLVAGGGLVAAGKTARRVATGLGRGVGRAAQRVGPAGVAVGAGVVSLGYAGDAEAGVLTAGARAAVRSLNGVSRNASAAQRKALATELRQLRGELQALRASGRQASSIANKQREIFGTQYGTRRMWARGYDLVGSMRYNGSGHGLDLIFRSRAGRLAVLETKYGRGGVSRLATDVRGMRQGSQRYIRDRLIMYQREVGRTALSQALRQQLRSGDVRSFASFTRSGRLYQLPQGFPPARGIIR